MRADPHSYADLDQARTEHLGLVLEIDFERRLLHGRATLSFTKPVEGALDLDTRGLELHEVIDPTGEAIRFEFAEPDPVLGQRLRLFLPRPCSSVTLRYTTSPEASALMWLDPAQTDGELPFVLTQCQAIHARSLVPLQDTPAARIRYSAELVVPEAFSAVMSAAPGEVEREQGTKRFRFEMPQPIPPYLLAFAVGDLDSRDLGPRCRVVAEPGMLDAAAWEFAEVERMLVVAEGLFGPYAWDRYDFIVLPPSFPLGGMENPRMTFLTPTLIAGDRSLVGVLAHELAHSWTGNLVTNATNEDFWLNEGWTVWAERRILEALYGEEEAKQQAILGRQELESTMAQRKRAGASNALHYDQSGLDPDEDFSQIPYEKGFLLVSALERAVGRERFDRFVAAYIQTFRFQSITAQAFVDFVRSALPEANGVDLDRWIHDEGLPDDAPGFHSERLDEVFQLAQRCGTAEGAWSTTEKLYYLSHLPTDVDANQVAAALGIDEHANAELRAAWFALAARAGTPGLEVGLRDFLGTVGRTKLLRPVYNAMNNNPELQELAQSLFIENEPRLHGSTCGVLRSILEA